MCNHVFLSMICDGVYFYLPGATCVFLFHLPLPGNRGIQSWRKLNLLGNHDHHSVSFFRSLSQYRSCSIQQCTMASPRTPTGTLSICLALVLLVLALWLTTARFYQTITFPLSNKSAGICGAELKTCGAHPLPSP